jgi:2'-5' RNA ligase
VRLFVALDLPPLVRQGLDAWRRGAAGDVPGLRPVAPEFLHVTLCFLGWRSSSEVGEIAAACAAAARPSPRGLSLGEAGWLPERGRPRVLAVGIDDPAEAIAALQSSLAEALQAGGWYAPEARPFLAHTTVARVGKNTRVRREGLEAPPPLAFDAGTVSLYRSRLGPGGARYEALRTVELGSPAQASEDPVAVVRRFHVEQGVAYAGGELERLRGLLAEDVVWHVPGRSKIAGEHRGIDAVLAYFDTRRRLTDETFRVSVRDVVATRDRVLQLAGGSAIRDGRTLTWETVGVLRVADGRIAECWLVPFDLYAFDEIWS